MRVLIAGGGSAGHINPAISIAKEIKKHNRLTRFMEVLNGAEQFASWWIDKQKDKNNKSKAYRLSTYLGPKSKKWRKDFYKLLTKNQEKTFP